LNELEIFFRLSFLWLAILLFLLSLISFLRTREIKIAFAVIGFAIFATEGVVLTSSIFFKVFENIMSIGFLVGANFVALIFFYLSIIKR
jgi:hypothetical protein